MGYEPGPVAAPFAPAADGERVIYRGGILFDGTGRAPSGPTSIVVEGDRIRLVAPDDEVPGQLLTDARAVELDGRFVVPGLIDSHQHLATPPNRPAAEALLRRQIYAGVTAIRDMADDLRQVADLARATRVGELPGPDIGYAALMAGPNFFDDPRTWQVSQGHTPGAVPWMQAITDRTDLQLAVAAARGTGATAIKVYADLDGDQIAAICAEAHRQGLAVWAHATVFPATPGEVVAAGVDSISHVTLLAHEGAARSDSYRDKRPIDYDRFAGGADAAVGALFAQLWARGVILDATASMWASDEPAEPDALARARANTELAAILTAAAHRAGVAISTGTDGETYPGQLFPAVHDEIEFLVRRCGFTAADALRAATAVGARSLGAEADLGTVEAGKLANLVVLTADPLADIGNLRAVSFVVKRGCRYDRADYAPGG